MRTPLNNSRSPAIALVSLAIGCGTIGLDGGAADTASSDPAGPVLRIDSLQPSSAPLAGGTEVTIRGTGFLGEVRFWFGNSEVTTTVLDPQTVVVSTPEVFVEATVDVKLVSEAGQVLLPGGFFFSDSSGGTGSGSGGGSGGSSSGGSSSGGGGSTGGGGSAGLVSGKVEVGAIAVGCPDCFGIAQTYVASDAVFHAPQAVDWLDYLPAQGTCTLNPAYRDPVSSSLNVGSAVFLQTGATTLTLTQTSREGLVTYQSPSATFDDYVKNASWDLSITDGGSLGPHTVSGAMFSTSGFTDIQPIEILSDTPYAFPYLSVGSGASFGWAPAGISDGVVIDLLVFNSLTGSLSGEVLCYARDTGAFVVPADRFGTFYVDDLVGIFLYRLKATAAVSPVDGSTIQGISSLGALGTGTLAL